MKKVPGPVVIIPELSPFEARVVGQLKRWLDESGFTRFRKKWVGKTLKEWSRAMPFRSERSIRTALKNLDEKGVIQRAHLAEDPRDRTLFYTILPRQGRVEKPMKPGKTLSQTKKPKRVCDVSLYNTPPWGLPVPCGKNWEAAIVRIG